MGEARRDKERERGKGVGGFIDWINLIDFI